MNNTVKTKKLITVLAGALFAFGLLFNTSLVQNPNGEVSLSLSVLENAKADVFEDNDNGGCEICEDLGYCNCDDISDPDDITTYRCDPCE